MLLLTNESELIFNDGITVLYFYALWMPMNKSMANKVKKISDSYKEIAVNAIDVDMFPTLCKRFSVESIPEIIIIKNGAEIKRINGIIMFSALKSLFADICKN